MTDSLTEEQLFEFKYSKKSHFDFFKKNNSEIELYGKSMNIEEDADLNAYQELLVYSYLKTKKNLNILQIGGKDLKSFEKLKDIHKCWKIDIEDLTKVHDELVFTCISKNNEPKISNPKSFFDFIFLPSAQNTIPDDSNIFKTLYSNIKYILKINGIFIGSFVNIVLENFVWVNNQISFFQHENGINNNGIGYSKIHNDPDLFVLTEHYYKKHWEKYTNKSYQEFGKPYTYNVIFENIGKIYPDNFQDFAYSKISHLKFYESSGYSHELGIDKSSNYPNIDYHQSLLVFATIKSNFKKNAKILQIGKSPDYLENKLNKEYDFYKLENLKKLCHPIDLNSENFKKEVNGKNENKTSNFNNYFDFIYFYPDNNLTEQNFFVDTIIFNNLSNMLKLGGLCLVSAKPEVKGRVIYYPHLFNFLFLNNIFRFNDFIKSVEILSDKDVYVSGESGITGSLNTTSSQISKQILYNLLWKKIAFLPLASITKPSNNLFDKPVYVFHHLMKCGGTSMISVLDKWFRLVNDNINDADINNFILKKYDVNNFFSDTCLTSHFQYEGLYLHQRYPEFLERNREFRIFIFMRDPLALRISLYYYAKKYFKLDSNVTLSGSLMEGKNFIASLLPCDETNYKQIMDRYFFIGIVEKLQESLDKFADMIGKNREKIPLLNITEKDSQVKELSEELISKFKQVNSLDYRIYEYGLAKFNELP